MKKNILQRFIYVASLLAFFFSNLANGQILDFIRATPSAQWQARFAPAVVAFRGSLWLTGGANNSTCFADEWESIDGTSWTLVTDSPPWHQRTRHEMVVFKDLLWLMGGEALGAMNDVWNSPDGSHWTEVTSHAPWRGRTEMSVAVNDGKLWVYGGVDNYGYYLNDVWFSEDGLNWIQATTNAPWPTRVCPGVSFQGKLWVLGGRNSTIFYNDVWCSSDGANWSEIAAHAPWTERTAHRVAIGGGNMWLLGGIRNVGSGHYSYSEIVKDLWRSPDGVSWYPMGSPAGSARDAYGAAVLNNKVFIMGGERTIGTPTNDVYYAELPSDAAVVVTGDRAWYEAGEGVTLRAVAEKFTGALTYQWLKDGQPVSGQTMDTLHIDAAALTDAGNYACTVTDEETVSRTSPPLQVKVYAAGAVPAAGLPALAALAGIVTALARRTLARRV